jgi:hypothetical protein
MKPPRDDLSRFLERVLPFIESDGARNLNQISRDLLIPYQTLRTRMMSIKDDGFRIAPFPDFAKLGLERVKVFFDLAGLANENLRAFFSGLDQTAGIRSYARSMYCQTFNCEFIIPRGTLAELEKLLSILRQMKLLEKVNVSKILWRDVLMLKAKYFDYAKKDWDTDFSRLLGDPSTQIPSMALTEEMHFDYIDLLMIKELEINPWIKTIDLGKKVSLSASDAAYHLNEHVFGRKLIRTFRLNWEGSRETRWLKHKVIHHSYIFNHVSSEDARHLISIFTSLPFTFSHMMTEDGSYVADVTFPLLSYLEATQYLSRELRAIGIVPSQIFEKDWSCLSTFTIPYKLYDRQISKWNFNAEKAAKYAIQMIETHHA